MIHQIFPLLMFIVVFENTHFYFPRSLVEGKQHILKIQLLLFFLITSRRCDHMMILWWLYNDHMIIWTIIIWWLYANNSEVTQPEIGAGLGKFWIQSFGFFSRFPKRIQLLEFQNLGLRFKALVWVLRFLKFCGSKTQVLLRFLGVRTFKRIHSFCLQSALPSSLVEG